MDEVNQIYSLPNKERYYRMRDEFNKGNLKLVRDVARLITANRKSKQGNWELATNFVQCMSEPLTTFENKQEYHFHKDLPRVNGYQCQYIRHKLQKGKNKGNSVSYISIINPDLNVAFYKSFGEMSVSEVNDLFNS